MVRLNDHSCSLGRTTTNQTKQKFKMLTFLEMTPSFRGVSQRVFVSRRKKNGLREISWSFLRESSRLRIFVRGVTAKKELFLGLICISS